ncbi:sugar phosphate isomerase/epimerase family protein [Brevibacillus migulae]|uniref:sugar phosphate isomerase/epimerase family protein n=1 Tax=Brevibacillus migulae TaxID=1644114 RepID=UPI00106ED975|nr:sugar phosphate isomerase/epimerase family protein [Brevibacillus migulae]
MKLSVQEHLIPGDSLSEKCAWLERHGFSGMELWAFDIEERIQEVKHAFSHSPIRITSLVGGYDGHLVHPSPPERQKAISGVRRLLRIAGELDADGVIIVPSFGISRSPGVLTPHLPATPDEIEDFGITLSDLAQEAQQAGTTIFVEVINRYESPAFNQIAEAAQAVQRTGSSHVKLLIDTFHMNIEETSITTIMEQHAPLIAYVHLADSNRRAPGQGHFPFHTFLHTLKKSAYRGYMTLECFMDSPDELIAAKAYIDSLIE